MARDKQGRSALHLVATNESIQAKKMVSLLLQNGGDASKWSYLYHANWPIRLFYTCIRSNISLTYTSTVPRGHMQCTHVRQIAYSHVCVFLKHLCDVHSNTHITVFLQLAKVFLVYRAFLEGLLSCLRSSCLLASNAEAFRYLHLAFLGSIFKYFRLIELTK